MNIYLQFKYISEKYPEKIALIHNEKTISFSELVKQVDIVSANLTDKGIKSGYRIMVFVPMGIDLYVILLAIFRIGAIAVFIDEWANRERLKVSAEIAECDALIAIPFARIYSLFSKSLRKIPVKLGLNFNKSKTMNYVAEKNLTDTALITFTTGSTGIPKAADRTHGFLMEQFHILTKTINAKNTDNDMVTLPIVLLMNLGIGATSVIVNFNTKKVNKLNYKLIASVINKYKVSRISASPFFVIEFAKFILKNRISVDSLNQIITGGASVFPDEAVLMRTVFSNCITIIFYGSTEAEPISEINAIDLANSNVITDRGLNVGKIHSDIKLKIIKIQNNKIVLDNNSWSDIELANGCIGEIIVTGNHVLKNYYKSNDAQKRNKIYCGSEIWHRTGDSGFIGNNGNLYLTGRCDNIFDLKSSSITPFVFEYFLKSVPTTNNGTLLMLRNKLIAIIESKKNCDKSEIEALIRQFVQIDSIVFIKKIPKDPRHHSKIDYDALKKAVLLLIKAE